MASLEQILVIPPIAFAVGFALQRGNVCSVLAARQIVTTGRTSRLRGLGLATLWAFGVLLPLVWFAPDTFSFSRHASPTLLTLLAGVVYASGCYINGACIFGVCSRVTAGHISFVFSIPAMAIGAVLGQYSGFAPQKQSMLNSPMSSPGIYIWVLWGGVIVFLTWSLYRLIIRYSSAGVTVSTILAQARWRSGLAALVIGVLGGALFATGSAWFYPAAVKRLTVFAVGLSDDFPLASLLGAGFVFLGGIFAALYRGRFVVRPPHLIPSVKAAVGGVVIGFAWALIPGGNDAMVMYLIPSLAVNAILAYAAMFSALVALEYLKHRRSSLA